MTKTPLRSRRVAASVALLLCGCGKGMAIGSDGSGGGSPDDTMMHADSGAPDAGASDMDAQDAGANDAGSQEPGEDAGRPDGGVHTMDAGSTTHDGGSHVDHGCDAGAIFCEDFEADGGLPGAPWSAAMSITDGGLLTVDSTKPYSGRASLHIKTPGKYAALTRMAGLPPPNNHVFGRMMVFLKSPWPATHVRLIVLEATHCCSGFALNANAAWGFRFEGLVDQFGGDGWEPVTPHLDQWVCLEWEINAHTPTEAKLWLDGTAVLPSPIGLPPVDITSLQVGFSSAQVTPFPIEMWIDDLILSTNRIGCPP
jgi:hypothetical protein